MGLLSAPVMMHSMVRRGVNLGFALYSDFAAQNFSVNEITRSFDYIYDFSRPSSKWVFGGGAQTGLLVEVPAGEEAIQHDPITGEALGVLLEGSATNSYLHSNDPSNPAWAATSGLSFSVQSSAIQGKTAYKITNDGSGAGKRIRQLKTATGNVELNYCIVEKASDDDVSVIRLQIFDNTAITTIANVEFNFNTETLSSVIGNAAFEKLLDVGPNGGPVYLVCCYATTTSGNTLLNAIYPTGNTANTQSSTFHHAQFEQGGIATSPIPTTASTVTRAADLLNSDPATFGGWYNPSGGTLKVTAQASDIGVTIATIGSLSIVSDSTEMKEYILVYGSDPSATELDLTPVGGSVIIKRVTYV